MTKSARGARPRRLASLQWEEVTGRHAVTASTGAYCRFDRTPTNSPHWHTYYEVCLALAGRGRFHHGGGGFELAAGDLFVADPGVVHEITSYETRDLELVFFTFTVREAAAPVGRGLEDRCVARFRRAHAICVRGQERLVRYLDWLEAEDARGAMGAHLARQQMRLLVFDMLDVLGAGAPERESAGAVPEDTLARAMRWIAAHVEQPLRVTDVAEAVHVSERTLRRLFRRAAGRGVLEVIHEQKMTFACHQLMMRFPVGEVSERCAMESPAHFSRLFKRQFGLSPKAYQLRYAPRDAANRTHHLGAEAV